MTTLRRRERARPRCSLCFEQLEAQAMQLTDCPGCDSTYHQLCLTELGGCATLGCSHQGARAAGDFALPEKRLEEIRRQVAEENRRLARLARRPELVEIERGPESLQVTLRPPPLGVGDLALGLMVLLALIGSVAGVVVLWGETNGAYAVAAFAAALAFAGYTALADRLNRRVIRVTPERFTARQGPLPMLGGVDIPTETIREVRYKHVALETDAGTEQGGLVEVAHSGSSRPAVILPFAKRPGDYLYVRDAVRDGLAERGGKGE